MSCRLAFIACLRLIVIGESWLLYDCVLSPNIVRRRINSSSFPFSVVLFSFSRNELYSSLPAYLGLWHHGDRVSTVASASWTLPWPNGYWPLRLCGRVVVARPRRPDFTPYEMLCRMRHERSSYSFQRSVCRIVHFTALTAHRQARYQ